MYSLHVSTGENSKALPQIKYSNVSTIRKSLISFNVLFPCFGIHIRHGTSVIFEMTYLPFLVHVLCAAWTAMAGSMSNNHG